MSFFIFTNKIMSVYYKFINACKNGNLESAKEIINLCKNVNISANNEELFRWACRKNHLEIAKWLYEINPNINICVNNFQTLRWACIDGNLELGIEASYNTCLLGLFAIYNIYLH